MEEFSNRTLAILIGIAIIISTIGILSVPKGGTTILGATVNTTSGTANVTIQATTQVTLLNNTVDFGTGFVNGSENFCILESNNSAKSAACEGFNAPAIGPYFVVENSGNSYVSLTLTGGTDARGFLCAQQTDPAHNCTLASPDFNWSAAEHEANSCISDPGISSRSLFNNSVNTTAKLICNNLDFNASSNSIRVALRIKIPRDTVTNLYSEASITFTGTG